MPAKASSSKSVLKPLSAQPKFSFSDSDDEVQIMTPLPKKSPARSTVVKRSPVKSKGKAKAVQEPEEEDEDLLNMMWVDRFAPTDRDTLAVHPRKVTDVNNWLNEAYNPKLAKYRRLLVLSGPSGAAKTATLKILAEEQEIEILEFRNGSNLSFGGIDTERESLVAEFTTFLLRAGMAPSLTLAPDPSFPSSHPSATSIPVIIAPPSTTTTKKRLILLEDLPNTSHYPTKLALRSALAQYLASPRVTCPLVVIISEALARPGNGIEAESTGNDGGRDESVDARNVCGMEILGAPGCREISFNSIAVTIMKKALSRTLDRIYIASSTTSPYHPMKRPSIKTLELIIAHSNGDIRSALMSLQFLASHPDQRSGASTIGAGVIEKKGKGKKRKKGGSDEEDGEQEDMGINKLLSVVTARESSLFIFHALGKVLYSKRWDVSAEEDKKDLGRSGILQKRVTDRLPRFLKEFRRGPSKVDPDVLFAEAPLSAEIFLSYLQHNYLQFTNTIEECGQISEDLSGSDALMRWEGETSTQRTPLTQQYSFALSTRSTLFHLPSPVPKRKQSLRKSHVWENMKMRQRNREEMELIWGRMRRGGNRLNTMMSGFGRKAGEEVKEEEGGQQYQVRDLSHEVLPWLGLIQRSRLLLLLSKPPSSSSSTGSKSKKVSLPSSATRQMIFLEEMTTFPPLEEEGGQEENRGEMLGEKELNFEENEDHGSDEREEEEENHEADEREEEMMQIDWDEEDDIVD